jgi:uncharacterized coiled-coil protein SlyX
MDAVTKAQLELTQAEADLRKVTIKTEAERKPIDEDEHESACASAIHDALVEEEAAVEEFEEEVEELEEEDLWQEQRIKNLETNLAEIKTSGETQHADLISRLEALKPSNPPPSEPPSNPNSAPVNPVAILEPKESVVPAAEQQRRKVRKI